METYSENTLEDLYQSFSGISLMSELTVGNSDTSTTCGLCQKVLSSESETTTELESLRLCGDCKFLLLEDRSPTRDINSSRSSSRTIRSRYYSSESIENTFLPQVSHISNVTSSRSTPSGSRRWQRASLVSDTDSDISFSGGYGAESDISIDNHSLLDTDIFMERDDFDPMHVGLNEWNFDDLDSTTFEAFLDRISETDDTRLGGAPPASLLFVNNLPRIVVTEEHSKHGDLTCAVCKDILSVKSEVIKLPCFHLYHPFCILPWLSERNSCPLCRYELPTDDKDYQDKKRDDESDQDPGSSGVVDRERESGRWFFKSAAPIIGVIGVVLVMWFGKPVVGPSQGQICNSRSHTTMNQQRGNWSLF